jgi:hypothetical protein
MADGFGSEFRRRFVAGDRFQSGGEHLGVVN